MPEKKLPPSQLLMQGQQATEDKKSNQEIVMQKVLDEFYNTDKIEMKTDLSDRLITKMVRVRMYADTFKCKPADAVAEYISKYKISKDRQGRKEAVDIIKQISAGGEDEDALGFRDRFLKGHR